MIKVRQYGLKQGETVIGMATYRWLMKCIVSSASWRSSRVDLSVIAKWDCFTCLNMLVAVPYLRCNVLTSVSCSCCLRSRSILWCSWTCSIHVTTVIRVPVVPRAMIAPSIDQFRDLPETNIIMVALMAFVSYSSRQFNQVLCHHSLTTLRGRRLRGKDRSPRASKASCYLHCLCPTWGLITDTNVSRIGLTVCIVTLWLPCCK